MKKILIVLAIAFLATFTVSNEKANAGITDYTTLWNAQNIYDRYDLTLGFSGLDVSSSYRWSVQLVNVLTGEPFADIGHHTHIPGTTTDSFSIGPGIVPLTNHLGDWPFQFTGPFQVKDNFGQIVMKGFLAPSPELYTGTLDWESNAGNNAYADKVVIGRATHVTPVFNPVYDNINVDGWHYQKNRYFGASAINDDIAIMHFNLDCATHVASGYTTESYAIYTFGGTEVARFEFSELLDMNERELIFPPLACGIANEMIYESFTVLNLGNTELPFLDNTRANAIFLNQSNPYLLNLPSGAYYVQKRSAIDAHVADGEAPFFITENGNGIEWSIEVASNSVSVNGIQQMIFKASTENLWTDYHGSSLCQDNSVTWQDLTTYSFTTARLYSNNVAGVVTANDFIECVVSPISIGTTTMTTTHAQVIYESGFYDVVAGAQTFDESINRLISASKLDTDNGKNLVFVLILFIAVLLITAVKPLRTNTFSYLIVWTGIGGAWVFAGPATALGIMMWSILTVVLWLLVLTGNQGGGEIAE